MSTPLTAAERGILEQIDAAVRSDAAAALIGPIVERVAGTMARNPREIEAWEPIPLDVYGGLLPAAIRSSWVFILRGGVTTGAERHPNSHQRMMSWKGEGDFQVHLGKSWQSHFMVSDRGARRQARGRLDLDPAECLAPGCRVRKRLGRGLLPHRSGG
jgi:hypothetical protein